MNIREKYSETLTERAYEALQGRVDRDILRVKARECADRLQFPDIELTNEAQRKKLTVSSEELIASLAQERSDKILANDGTVFKNQNTAKNHLGAGLDYLARARKTEKSKMYDYDRETTEYKHHDLIQSIYKIIMNSVYGILNSKRSFLYNKHLGPCVTYAGWSLITHMMCSFEDFTNNPRHRDAWELAWTIDLILSAQRTLPLHKLRVPTHEDLLHHLNSQCEIDYEDPEGIIPGKVYLLTSEQRQRVYYAYNSIAYFQDTSDWQHVLLDSTLPRLNAFDESTHAPYLDVMREILDVCCYPRYLASRENRAQDNLVYDPEYAGRSVRKIVIISDTDSTFLNFGYWISHLLETNRIQSENTDQMLGFLTLLYQEVARASIDVYCEAMNIPTDHRSKISMKSEYYMNRVLITNKRNYIARVLNREGTDEDYVDIKGLNVKKVNTPKSTRDLIKNELIEKLLMKSERIHVRNVLEWLEAFDLSIERAIREGSLEYGVPKNIKRESDYAFPDRMEHLRGAWLWNHMYPNTPVQIPSKAIMVKLETFYRDDVLAFTHVDDQFKQRLLELFDENEVIRTRGVTALTIPYGYKKIPEEFIPMVDVRSSVNAQIDVAKPLMSALGLNLVNSGGATRHTNQALLTINPEPPK